jgi:hypothetical protein
MLSTVPRFPMLDDNERAMPAYHFAPIQLLSSLLAWLRTEDWWASETTNPRGSLVENIMCVLPPAIGSVECNRANKLDRLVTGWLVENRQDMVFIQWLHMFNHSGVQVATARSDITSVLSLSRIFSKISGENYFPRIATAGNRDDYYRL